MSDDIKKWLEQLEAPEAKARIDEAFQKAVERLTASHRARLAEIEAEVRSDAERERIQMEFNRKARETP